MGGAEEWEAPPRYRTPALVATGPSTRLLSYISAPIYTSLNIFKSHRNTYCISTVAKFGKLKAASPLSLNSAPQSQQPVNPRECLLNVKKKIHFQR